MKEIEKNYIKIHKQLEIMFCEYILKHKLVHFEYTLAKILFKKV